MIEENEEEVFNFEEVERNITDIMEQVLLK